MNLAAQFAQFKPELEPKPELAKWVGGLVKSHADLINQARLDAAKIEALTFELARYKRLQFAAKSEQYPPVQLELFAETCTTDISEILAEVEQVGASQTSDATEPAATQRPRAGRQPLPDHLPRIEHRHEPESCTCGQCGQDLVKIREDISEQLDVEPARFFVHRHIRPQYACRACETISAAPIPPAVIDGGMAAVGLYAWVIIGKYVDHLPLYRLEQIAARSGVTLSRSTLAEWVGRIGCALQPLAERLAVLLRERPALHADETPVQQLDPGSGKTKRAYLWAYRSNSLAPDPPIVVFDYQTSRAGTHACNFLSHWKGYLMVDGYAGYQALFKDGVTELACLAHARRKFFDLHAANGNALAQEALRRIGVLYAIEQEGKALDVAVRTQLRQSKAIPELQALHDWLYQTRATVADGGALAKAIDYSLKRWSALSRYASNGRLPIDNNAVENAIRPIALGRKNWLFAGSERAGKRAAAIQSLLATAKLNGIEPAAWLRETLENLPTCRQSQIDSLLPLHSAELK
ncbi:MAG: IS66 family transposase [Pseudomonadota bacterium]